MTSTLPQFLRDLIASPPRHGEGVHNWIFRVARQLHAHYPDKEQLADLIAGAVASCGRAVSRREIMDAISNSSACSWRPDHQARNVLLAATWPKLNQEQIDAIVHEGAGLADLWEASPIRIEDNNSHAEAVISHLFPGNPLLCCGASQSAFDTLPRTDWHGRFEQLQFIVPSPMSAPTGLTKDGRTSKHTLANTGPRRFLICEFDHGAADTHAAILLHLGRYAPLVCAVHSGGKSLHGWFLVAAQPEAKVAKFFRYAVSLGADRATWTRSQFVRMPDGTRENGRRQTIYFLNLKPLETLP